MPELAKWDNFYVIVGSAAGALIGLQFVVMTLVAARPPAGMRDGAPAYATPTIVHFGAVLLLSALVHVPWETTAFMAATWGFLGFAGVAYIATVARRMGRTAYRPEFEDWLFHAALPLIAYACLAVTAFTATVYPREALLGVGGAALVLLFSGIHNAWDAVVYHVLTHYSKPDAGQGDERKDS